MRVSEIGHDGDVLRACLDDGRELALHALQLRDSCPCQGCRHRGTGQRLLETSSLPVDLRIETAVAEGDGAVRVGWSDSHLAQFSAEQLAELAPRAAEERPHWGAELALAVPSAEYGKLAGDERA